MYDLFWNWVCQDVFSMYFDIIFGRFQVIDCEIVSQCICLMNCFNFKLFDFMQYYIDNCLIECGEIYKLVKKFVEEFMENCKDVFDVFFYYKDVFILIGLCIMIDVCGNFNYEEILCVSCRKFEYYVQQMVEGGKIFEYGNCMKVQSDLF